MIYIVDYNFIVSNIPQKISQSGSIMEQLARKNIPNIINTKDTFFHTGEQYRIKYILPTLKQEKKVIKYIFENIATKEVLEKEFLNVSEAEDFIAHLSGLKDQLRQLRDQAQSAWQQV